MLVKKLVQGRSKIGGRNFMGRITSYHRGGGIRRSYRFVDLSRKFLDMPAKILKVYRDRFRSGLLFLVIYSNGFFSYILGTDGVALGCYVLNKGYLSLDVFSDISRVGSSFLLKDVLPGERIHSLESFSCSGGVYARAGGVSIVVVHLDKVSNRVLVRLPSGFLRFFSGNARCVIGSVLGIGLRRFYKAGQRRWLGHRPIVRGVAMNPVDHPHGGGEGKTSGGRCSVTPWGKLTKGVKTRRLPRKFIKGI